MTSCPSCTTYPQWPAELLGEEPVDSAASRIAEVKEARCIAGKHKAPPVSDGMCDECAQESLDERIKAAQENREPEGWAILKDARPKMAVFDEAASIRDSLWDSLIEKTKKTANGPIPDWKVGAVFSWDGMYDNNRYAMCRCPRGHSALATEVLTGQQWRNKRLGTASVYIQCVGCAKAWHLRDYNFREIYGS